MLEVPPATGGDFNMELPHRNSTVLDLYHEEMEAWTTQYTPTAEDIDPLTAATLLGATMEATINATAKLTARRRAL